MATLQQTLKEAHDWANSRISHLAISAVDLKDPELVEDAESIRREFEEWLDPVDEQQDIYSLEYIGDGSEYD